MSQKLQIPLGKGVRVIESHDCGLILLDKPDGTLSMPNRDSEISAAEAAHGTEVLVAAYRSASTGEVVKLPMVRK